ncbi:MAG TPA: hypothetical protein VHD90_12710 [Phototrophicaceae bacterium]|nr:hypothetical protein [Phototrophicaceae bacterium]
MLLLALAQTVPAPPDTTNFLWLALGVFFLILVVFLATMAVRSRNLRRDEALIEQMNNEQ